MLMNVLFVCTGNTCRSPMAAAVLRTLLDDLGNNDIIVDSAGISTFSQPIAPNTLKVLKEWNQDAFDFVSNHVSKQVTPELLKDFEIIVALSPQHLYALKEIVAPNQDLRLLADGIPDPFGADIDVYRNTLQQMLGALKELANELNSLNT